jgi:hypothetical protein
MLLLVILASLVYLAAGSVVWLVTCLMFAGKVTSPYLSTIYAAAKKNTVLEVLVASGVVTLWPLHLAVVWGTK